MLKKWSDFYNDLMPALPGCSKELLDHELRRAAQDFFNRSRAWRVTLDPISLEAGLADYELIADDRAMSVVRIEEAGYLTSPLKILSLPEMITRYGADWHSRSGQPEAITQLRPGVATIYATPSADVTDALLLTVAVKPSDSANGIDEDMATRFREELILGAKGRLMLMPKKPWTDGQAGSLAAAQFGDRIDTARSQAERAYGRARVRVKPVWC